MEEFLILIILAVIIVAAYHIVNLAKLAGGILSRRIIVLIWIICIGVPIIIYKLSLSLFASWMTFLLAHVLGFRLSTASIIAYLLWIIIGLIAGIRIAKVLSLRLVKSFSINNENV